jgi:hypothetical protein
MTVDLPESPVPLERIRVGRGVDRNIKLAYILT